MGSFRADAEGGEDCVAKGDLVWEKLGRHCIIQTSHSHNPKLNLNFRIMKTDEISELEVNDELIAMISGEFENTSDVAERPEWLSREHQLTSTSC